MTDALISKKSKVKKILGSVGQSVLEYSILLAIVSAAFLLMTLYVKRAVQGGLNRIDNQIAYKMANRPSPVPPVPPPPPTTTTCGWFCW
jgi:hypothetical protein